MEQKLELLVGDRYALKDNSLIILVGDSGCVSLQSSLGNTYTKEKAAAEGNAILERIMENVNKEAGYQSIFGIGNSEAALRQAISLEKEIKDYNIFLYKLPEGVELEKGFSTWSLAEEVIKQYQDLHERYLICRESYGKMSDSNRKIELQQKMRMLADMVKEGKDTSAMEYIVTYLAKKTGSEYESIVNDTIEIIAKTNQLSKLGVEVNPTRFTLLDWNRELLIATSLCNQEKMNSLGQAVAKYKNKINSMLETKQKEKNRQG
jgi:hypothetical protein